MFKQFRGMKKKIGFEERIVFLQDAFEIFPKKSISLKDFSIFRKIGKFFGENRENRYAFMKKMSFKNFFIPLNF